MARYVLSDGCFSVSIRYLTTNRDGVFWYYRRVPLAAKAKLGISSHFVRVSLSTRDRTEAIRRLIEVNAQFETRWLDGSPGNAEGTHSLWSKAVLNQAPCSQTAGPSRPEGEACPTIGEALDLYLSQHPNGRNKRFRQNAQIAIGYLIEAVGDLPLDSFTRQNALAVRNAILAKNKTASVKRRFNTINAIFNAAIQEGGLKLSNPFSGIRIVNLGGDSEKREEFTIEELKKLANACQQVGDDRRLIILMLMDTGARLGEIVGLRVSDVDLGQPLPHIHIRPFDGRTLKTASSTRKVPLMGEALWAAKKAMVGKDKDGLLFPDYGPAKANSASAALNKWIKKTAGIQKTIHGLRHSMKTRLVIAGVPEDIRNRIGGWTDGETVSRGYGSYPLEVLAEWLREVTLG